MKDEECSFCGTISAELEHVERLDNLLTSTPEEKVYIAAYLKDLAEGHDDHTLEQVGPCVYCIDCNKRLYQGRIAADHKKVKVYNWNAPRDAKATKDMRERWNK